MADHAQRKAALDDTVAKMCNARKEQKENGFTLGWDVVVSYSEPQINELLKTKWEKVDSKIIKTIEMKSLVYNEDTEAKETVVRTLNVGAPMIRFAGGAVSEPAAELLMPISGGSRQKEDAKGQRYGPKTAMPENAFTIRLSGIRLGTVSGKYQEIKNSTDPPIKNSKEGCLFRSDLSKPTVDDYEVAWVVLDFPMAGSDFNVNVDVTLKPSHVEYEKANTMVNSILGSVSDYFKKPQTKINALDYALATVKNTPQYNGGMTVDLTPVQFRMATFAASYHQERSISLFIQTISGRDSGEKNDLQVKWMGQWTGLRTEENSSPVPAGYSSSLLFNHDLVYNAMIRPGLEKNNDWTLDEKQDATQSGGIGFIAHRQKAWWTSGFSYDYEAKFNNCRVEVASFTKDLKDDPATIHIFQKETDGPPKAHIDWTFWTENEWEDSTQDPKWWNAGERALFGSGNIRTTYTFKDELPLNVTVTDNDFSFNIDTTDMKKKWTFKEESVDRKGNWFEKAGKWLADFLTAGPPEDVDNKRREWMTGLRPDISFNIVGLGFFLTTNLLMPGAKVIELDKEAGIRLPRDIMLVGDVMQGVDTIKS